PPPPGAYDQSCNGGVPAYGGGDSFVTKLNSSGTALVYSTYIGGSLNDPVWATSIAIDECGNAYVTGGTDSVDFPTTPGAYDRTYNGNQDGWVAKLNSSGSNLAYSTYLGGTGQDSTYYFSAIAVDSSGKA